MVRWLALLVSLAALLGAGVVHGLWTDRWQRSEALTQATERLQLLPADLDDWKGRAEEQDPDALAVTGAVAHYSRSFLDPVTGDRVLVILLAGKPARMSVHRPEHCYTAAGYDLVARPIGIYIRADGEETAEFFTGTFTREEAAGPSQLRIFWSFFARKQWESPVSPRVRFAREQVLYKLYVLRSVAASLGSLDEDPCIRLLGKLLPVLNRTLADR